MEIKRDKTLTEAQQLAAYVLRFHMRPYNPQHPYEMRRWLHEFMLIGFLWFEEGIPENADVPFPYQLNPRPLESMPDPDITHRILKYGQDELEFICGKLKRPKWASKRNDLRGQVTLAEVCKIWQASLFFSDLHSHRKS